MGPVTTPPHIIGAKEEFDAGVSQPIEAIASKSLPWNPFLGDSTKDNLAKSIILNLYKPS